MPLLRRAIALAVLTAAVYGALNLRGSELGLAGPLFFAVAVVVGLGALAVLLLGLPIARVRETESGFEHSLLSERQGNAFGAAIVFLFGVLLLFLAARGVYRDSMPLPWSAPDASFSLAPLRYLAALLFWLGAGASVIAFSWKLFRLRSQAQPRDARDAGGP